MRRDYCVTVSKSLEDQRWDDFVATASGGHHVQTTAWARVKATLGWSATRISVSDDGKIVGGAQLLARAFPVIGRAGYVSRGPICCREDPDLARVVLREVLEVSRRNRCRLIAIQPPCNGEYLTCVLESLGFAASNLELAPTASLVIDLGQGLESIEKGIKRRKRHHIRRSEREGIVVREGSLSDLEAFYPLYLATAQRQGFTPYTRKYFDALWQAFAPRGWITLLVACYRNEAISAQLLVPFGDTVIAKMAGWSGGCSKLRPNDALYWASIQWGVNNGYRHFDFEGVDPRGARLRLAGEHLSENPRWSQDIIKYDYGGKVVLYPPVYDYLPNRIFNWIYRRMSGMIDGNSLPYRLVERLRKR